METPNNESSIPTASEIIAGLPAGMRDHLAQRAMLPTVEPVSDDLSGTYVLAAPEAEVTREISPPASENARKMLQKVYRLGDLPAFTEEQATAELDSLLAIQPPPKDQSTKPKRYMPGDIYRQIIELHFAGKTNAEIAELVDPQHYGRSQVQGQVNNFASNFHRRGLQPEALRLQSPHQTILEAAHPLPPPEPKTQFPTNKAEQPSSAPKETVKPDELIVRLCDKIGLGELEQVLLQAYLLGETDLYDQWKATGKLPETGNRVILHRVVDQLRRVVNTHQLQLTDYQSQERETYEAKRLRTEEAAVLDALLGNRNDGIGPKPYLELAWLARHGKLRMTEETLATLTISALEKVENQLLSSETY